MEEQMDDDGVATCVICGGTPCEWEEFGEGIRERSKHLYNRKQQGKQEAILDDNGVIIPNSILRKALYKAFAYLEFGHHKTKLCFNFNVLTLSLRTCLDNDLHFFVFQNPIISVISIEESFRIT
jgi:hypothetical protein